MCVEETVSKISILIEEREAERAEEITLGIWVELVQRVLCLIMLGSLDLHSVFHHLLE